MLAGVVAIAFGVWLLQLSLRSTGWPVTEGVISSGEIRSRSGGKGGKTYSAAISYDYRVSGAAYTSTRLAYGVMDSTYPRAQAVLKRYPIGSKVEVHYAPGDPGEAVLEPGVHGGTWICFAVGAVFEVAGAGFLGLFSRATSAPDNSPFGMRRRSGAR